MDIYEALYTTRAMRRVLPDPIPMDVQAQILDAAVRAPSGGNTQGWRFLLVDDHEVKAQLAPLYQQAIANLWQTIYADRVQAAAAEPDKPSSITTRKMMNSVQWMGDHFTEIPLLMFAFSAFDTSGGSIWPALWSAQLAARANGVGSAPTSILGIFHPEETFKILGVPTDQNWNLAAMVSFGYPKGVWGVAERRPAHKVSYRNHWGEPIGFEIEQPLWSPEA
jgi:hypothetical protein